nr:MAG TPA: hypothetical protein [Caudoviricetes sp.]
MSRVSYYRYTAHYETPSVTYAEGVFVVFIDNLPYLKTILPTVLAYYYRSGFWVWVFNIDWILQFFYITKQIINSLNYLFIL